MADDMAVAINTKTLVIDSEILDLVAELDEFKGAWRALSTLAPDRLSALRRVATIESIGSSARIEGNKLSDRDVEKLLSVIEIQTFNTRDEQEVAGYAAVMETIFASWSVLTLTENHIKQIHGDLLRYSTKDKRHRGEYKKLDNHVVAFDAKGKSVGIVFLTASPFDTPRLMTQLVEWISETLARRTLHPLVAIAVFIVLFLQIHPFQDGNGRLSRALTTLLLLKAGYDYVPYSSLERIVEEHKVAYYAALRGSQATVVRDAREYRDWLAFFLGAVRAQQQSLATTLDSALQRAGLVPAQERILDAIRTRGPQSSAALAAMLGLSARGVRYHLHQLTESGQLSAPPRRAGRVYSLPE